MGGILSRREWLVSLTAAGVTAAAVEPVHASRDAEDDNSINGIIARLGSVGNVTAAASARLDAINAVLGTPPDDSKPTLQAKVDVIRANLNDALNTLELIQDKLATRG